MTTEQKIFQIVDPKFKLEIEKNSRGFNYSISVKEDDLESLKKLVLELNEFCKENFGGDKE